MERLPRAGAIIHARTAKTKKETGGHIVFTINQASEFIQAALRGKRCQEVLVPHLSDRARFHFAASGFKELQDGVAARSNTGSGEHCQTASTGPDVSGAYVAQVLHCSPASFPPPCCTRRRRNARSKHGFLRNEGCLAGAFATDQSDSFAPPGNLSWHSTRVRGLFSKLPDPGHSLQKD